MTLTLPLKEMSRTEKLRMLEDIWQDLASSEPDLPSPGWHEKVLNDTERLVASGGAAFSDWESAKIRIRQRAAQLQ